MKNLRSIIIFAGLAIILVGCSSPKDASKDNFKRVINTYLAKKCIWVSPHNSNYPVTIKLLPLDKLLPSVNELDKRINLEKLRNMLLWLG